MKSFDIKIHLTYTFYSVLTLTFLSCQPATQSRDDYSVVEVGKSLSRNDVISIKEDIVNIEYIFLETTDESLISNLLSMQVNDDYIFCYNGKTDKILQFDRKGNFLKEISRQGNGPGEFGLVNDLYINNDKQELYVFQVYDAPIVFTFEGNYLRSDTVLNQAGGMKILPGGKKALIGKTMLPVQQAPWLVALQDDVGKIIYSKSPYPQFLQSEVCYMKEINYTPSNNSILGYTPCNDTIFRVSTDKISPAYVLKRENPAEYYTTVADIYKLSEEMPWPVIDVYDFFETTNYFYCRVYKDNDIHIIRYNRETEELLSRKIPEDYLDCSRAIPGNNVIGIDNDFDNGVPFWPEFYVNDKCRAQVIEPYMISDLRDRGYLRGMPEVLKIDEDDNPIIIIYTFK